MASTLAESNIVDIESGHASGSRKCTGQGASCQAFTQRTVIRTTDLRGGILLGTSPLARASRPRALVLSPRGISSAFPRRSSAFGCGTTRIGTEPRSARLRRTWTSIVLALLHSGRRPSYLFPTYTVVSPTPVAGVGGSDTAIVFGCATRNDAGALPFVGRRDYRKRLDAKRTCSISLQVPCQKVLSRVPKGRLELPRPLRTLGPEPSASANSATSAADGHHATVSGIVQGGRSAGVTAANEGPA